MDTGSLDDPEADAGGDGSADNLAMGIIRKEVELTFEEKQFLLAIERGDMATAKNFLEEALVYCNININCVDPLGRSALLIAIENENIEMIEILLRFNVELGDALLHAINEENVEAVELILNHIEKVKKKPDSGILSHGCITKMQDLVQSLTGRDTADASQAFTPDITPLILAAHRDNYEIIKILLNRGATLPQPHDVRCNCKDCSDSSQEDSLRHSRSRINAYRALSSPSLIALSSKDPILTAFELSWELRRLSNIENEFRSEYEQLSKKCQEFATALLEQTRTSQELEIILNHDSTGPVYERGEKMRLGRLKLAIKYRQKKFVAHPNCQQLLASIWYDGLPGFRRQNIVFKVILIGIIGCLFPVFSAMYLLAPKSRLGKVMRKPFIKFICQSASYVAFLILLILASQRIESLININSSDGSSSGPKNERRGPPPTVIEWMIMTWIAGLVWTEIKQLWDDGLYEYIHDMWNVLDFITNSLYIATIGLRVVAYLQVQKEISENKFRDAYAQRQFWDAYDPTLISEGLFATANIFSSLKLVYIFSINPHLGPLQISLGRMVIDIIKFFFFFMLVLFSFACGLNQLMWYYAELRANECQRDGPTSEACATKYTRFSNLFETVQTLIFAIFGLIDLEHLELKEKHSYTEFVGRLMFGSYSTIAIVVLLNMLIAMMSNSYQSISNQADIEWKFARSKLWVSCFEEGGTLPPPFNIIPSPKTFFYLLKWFYNKLCSCSKKQKRTRWKSLKRIVRKVNERDARYQAVMRNLVKRYITNMQRTQQAEGVTEDDVQEIKQDISAFRFELLEILKNSGMKTEQSDKKNPARGSKKGRLQERRLMKGFQIDPIPEVETYSLPEFMMEDEEHKKDTKEFKRSLSSPIGKLSRFTRFGSRKQNINPAKRWENLVTAARIEQKRASLCQKNSDAESVTLPSPASEASSSSFAHIAGFLDDENQDSLDNLVEVNKVSGYSTEMHSGNSSDHSETDNPFSRKTGPVKRVSFLWKNTPTSTDGQNYLPQEPYVYNGATASNGSVSTPQKSGEINKNSTT